MFAWDSPHVDPTDSQVSAGDAEFGAQAVTFDILKKHAINSGTIKSWFHAFGYPKVL